MRVLILVAVIAALYAAAELSGLRARLTLDGIRAMTAAAGAWGMLLYLAVFAASQLAYVPGMVFVVAAVLSYGRLWGGLLGWSGAVIAVSLTFIVVRTVGGRAPKDVERPFFRRILDTLDARPLSTILFLRLVFWLGPTVSYGLALSRVRFRDYVVGSALGLMLPIAGVTMFTDRVVAWLSK